LALEDNALPGGSLNEDENVGVRGIPNATREPKRGPVLPAVRTTVRTTGVSLHCNNKSNEKVQ
jgi:hypothetical protein